MKESPKKIIEEPILPSPEVSSPKLYDMVMRQNTGERIFKDMVESKDYISTSNPKIEFIAFNNISIDHNANITNNDLFDLIIQNAINMIIINKNIENIINHINNEQTKL